MVEDFDWRVRACVCVCVCVCVIAGNPGACH